MNLITLTWKNLWYKPWNTSLSLLLFAMGVGLISFIFLINKQVQEQFENNLADIDLVIGAKGSPLQMILCNMYHVDVPTGNISIEEARPFLRADHPLIKKAVPLSLGDSYRGFRIVGTTTGILELYGGEIREGEIWEETFEVTAGAEVAHKLGLKVGDSFYSSHGFMDDPTLVHDHGDAFRVVGILEGNGTVLDQLLLTNTHSVWAVHDHGDEEAGDDHDHAHDHAHEHEGSSNTTEAILEHPEEEITSILVRFNFRNYQTLNLLRNINENTGLQAAAPAIEINKLYSQIGVGMDVLKRLGYLIAIVSGLSIFISLISTLKERRYELAQMRVMGSSRRQLFLLIILEGLTIAVLGFIAGILCSHLAGSLFAGMVSDSYQYTIRPWIFLPEEAWIFAGAIAIGFLAAFVPALQASRTDISETLTKNS